MFVYNDSNSVTTIYLQNKQVDLQPKKGFLLDQTNMQEATKWTAAFTSLKLVEVIPEATQVEKVKEDNSTKVTFTYEDNSIIVSVPVIDKDSKMVTTLNVKVEDKTYSVNSETHTNCNINDLNKIIIEQEAKIEALTRQLEEQPVKVKEQSVKEQSVKEQSVKEQSVKAEERNNSNQQTKNK